MARGRGFSALIFLLLCLCGAQCLKCVCNKKECDVIRPQDCPGRGIIVLDPCRCCWVCARTLGEPCGGPGGFSGRCEAPLHCVERGPSDRGVGTCQSIPSESPLSCTETKLVSGGCDIVDRKCVCALHPVIVCADSHIHWFYRDRVECQLNLDALLKKENSLDDEATVRETRRSLSKRIHSDVAAAGIICPPFTSLNDSGVCVPTMNTALDNPVVCSNIKCPHFEPCPMDSYQLPDEARPIEFTTDVISNNATALRTCCPEMVPTKCFCKPCVKPTCDPTLRPNFVRFGTSHPGDCCDEYICVEKDICMQNGKSYVSGESWMRDQCTKCFCKGQISHCGIIDDANCHDFVDEDVVAFRRVKPRRNLEVNFSPADDFDHHYEQSPPEELHEREINPNNGTGTDSDSPSGCLVTINGNRMIYNNEEKWQDHCDECICVAGQTKCTTSYCKVTCENPTEVLGECCPRCETSCPYLKCKTDCATGYKMDEHNCQTCHCLNNETHSPEIITEVVITTTKVSDNDKADSNTIPIVIVVSLVLGSLATIAAVFIIFWYKRRITLSNFEGTKENLLFRPQDHNVSEYDTNLNKHELLSNKEKIYPDLVKEKHVIKNV